MATIKIDDDLLDNIMAQKLLEIVRINHSEFVKLYDEFGEQGDDFPEFKYEDMFDNLNILQAAKELYKYHTTHDKHKVLDNYTVDIMFEAKVGGFCIRNEQPVTL